MDVAISVLGVSPREIKTDVCTKICMQLIAGNVCVTASNWKQSKYLATAEHVNKIVVSPCSGVLLNSKQGLRKNPKIRTPSERRQTIENACHIPFI